MAKKKPEELSMTASVVIFLVGAACLLGMLAYKKNTQRPAKPKQQVQKMSAKEQEQAANIFGRAFTIGRTMARAGVIEPTAAEIDAMSRATQTKIGDTHARLWFKQHFQNGFWAGWESR
jgi:hypothetical protein